MPVTINGTSGIVSPSLDLTTPLSFADGGAGVLTVSRTSNVALTSSNLSNLINITSGTFTQTFDACSSLGNGWFVYLRNNGSGDITLDPNGSETIDGLTSYVMYPGEVRLIQCNGTALISVVLNAFYRKFTATGTFTKPPGYKAFSFDVISGGGGGSTLGGGGGGGRYWITYPESLFSTNTTMTVGAGGAGTSTSSSTSAGGNSQIGSLLIVYGSSTTSNGSGNGGGIIAGSTSFSLDYGFLGAPGSNGNQQGSSGVWGGGGGGYNFNTLSQNRGGSSIFAGGGGGGIYSTFYGAGGTSGTFDIGGGGAANSSGAGGNGANATSDAICGSGGGAGSTIGGNGGIPAGGGGAGGTTGGAGARGEIRVWGVI